MVSVAVYLCALSPLLGVAVAGVDSTGAPTPGLIPRSWELDFAFHDPQRITVQHAGQTEGTTYWYLLYSVTNQTDRDVEFHPTFELVTDSMQKSIGGEEISTTVFEAIRVRHHRAYPFLIQPSRVSGRLLQGEDNSISSVAIFRQFDPGSNQFAVYVAGLSGEVTRVSNPSFDAAQPESGANPPFFFLRKTLAVRYVLPGDVKSRRVTKPTRVGRGWVMR